MATQARTQDHESGLESRFVTARALSTAIAAPLSDADATIQPMPDASPAKWHLAHTTWFFETFVLRDHVPGHVPLRPDWSFLFNSYYEAEGARHCRDRRGMLSRPSLAEILSWREDVDAAILQHLPDLGHEAQALVELGLQHEAQHQELMLMDLTATFWANPLLPALYPAAITLAPSGPIRPLRWIEGQEGLTRIGHEGAGFAFDCEGPRHRVVLTPHALGDRLVTNGEWCAFIEDGGYSDPLLWLADGWAWVQREGIEAPLYWRRRRSAWQRFALDGLQPVNPAEPVSHISLYEADAFARWAGARLPTEAEWESAAASLDPISGNQLDAAGPVRPVAASSGTGLRQMFGDVWEWTGSAYLAYPGFRPAPGAVGEYNGKFMSGQMVLRGGSCATPRGHVRASYRNFFFPHQRWAFSGLRLAKDL